jgi:hypothetical protein
MAGVGATVDELASDHRLSAPPDLRAASVIVVDGSGD